jgi:putative FmdB family regulatory protein
MIYEYECPVHQIFEIEQTISESPLQECPMCRKNDISSPVKKLISLSSFHLAGAGWARDNYSK